MSPLQATVSSLRRVPSTLGVALAMAVAQLPFFNRTLVSLDEGQMTAIGHRLVLGDVLYRDAHTGVFPGIYWLAQALFTLFGSDALVLRGAQLTINALIAASLFALARPMVPGRSVFLIPLSCWILVVLSFPGLTMLTYSAASLVSALLALVFLRRYIVSAAVADGVVGGLLIGACVVFKQNFGLYTLAAVSLAGLWTRREGRLAEHPWIRAFGVPAAATTLIGGAAIARLVCSGAWPDFFESTFIKIFELSEMEAYNQPLPPVLGAHPPGGMFLFYYAPAAMFLGMFAGDPIARPETLSVAVRIGYGAAYLSLALTPALVWKFAYSESSAQRTTARLVLPFCTLFFLGIFPSAIWSHLAIVMPPLLIPLAAAGAWMVTGARRRAPVLFQLGRTSAIALALAGMLLAVRMVGVIRGYFPEPLGLPGASLMVTHDTAQLHREGAQYLRSCAAEGEAVFVATDMPILYVASGRRNPTPYDLVIPGDIREDRLIEAIEKAGVACVVFSPRMYAQFAPFEELFPRLAAHLAERFVLVGTTTIQDNGWRFLRRRGTGGAA